MSCSIIVLKEFSHQVKKLAKKYKKIKEDLKNLSEELKNDPKVGIPLGEYLYKIRVANPSTSTGKRGGFRVIYYYLDTKNNLYLINIYSKTEQQNISEAKLYNILKNNNLTKEKN